MKTIKFVDGKIANLEELFDGVRFSRPDRRGSQGAMVEAWVNEDDKVSIGMDNADLVWGKVQVGGTYHAQPCIDGKPFYYRIHPTVESHITPSPANHWASTADFNDSIIDTGAP